MSLESRVATFHCIVLQSIQSANERKFNEVNSNRLAKGQTLPLLLPIGYTSPDHIDKLSDASLGSLWQS
jgi:hypothetical protein